MLVYPIILHLTLCAWNEKTTRYCTTKIQIQRAFIFLQLQFLSSVSKHKNKYSYVIRNPVYFVMKNGLKHMQVFFAAVSLEYEA